MASNVTNMTSEQQYCTFLLGGFYMGVDVRSVQEVLRCQPMTRVPLTSDVIRGLINVRGQIVMAIDLRFRLHLPEQEQDRLSTNVIVNTDDGVFSLLVDEVCDVLDLDESKLQPPPDTLDPQLRELIRGVHLLPDRILMVLDTETITDPETLKQTAT
jgi:purine-binding chemotaxis protein CheW